MKPTLDWLLLRTVSSGAAIVGGLLFYRAVSRYSKLRLRFAGLYIAACCFAAVTIREKHELVAFACYLILSESLLLNTDMTVEKIKHLRIFKRC